MYQLLLRGPWALFCHCEAEGRMRTFVLLAVGGVAKGIVCALRIGRDLCFIWLRCDLMPHVRNILLKKSLSLLGGM
ncbi:hypothetical protein BDW72DRAFT_183021 [Aspergillus terricola var. indicus]